MKIKRIKQTTEDIEEARLKNSESDQQRLVPEIQRVFRKHDTHPFTALESLGTAMVEIMVAMQEINPDQPLEKSYLGFLDTIAARIRQNMPIAIKNGQAKYQHD